MAGRSNPHGKKGDPRDPGAAGADSIPDLKGGQLAFRLAGAGICPFGSAAEARAECHKNAPVFAGAGDGRHVPNPGPGGGRDAAAHGHFLSPVYPFGGFWLSAPGGVSDGRLVRAVPCLRQAGPDHVHGLWLQRGGGDGLPHHRQPPGAADGHFDQQPGALQRTVPNPDCPDDAVFCGQGPRRHGAGHGRSDGPGAAGGRHDAAVLPRSVRHGIKRRALLLRFGAAALPQTSDRAGAGAQCAGPDAVRAGKGRGCGGPGGTDHFPAGSPRPGRRIAAYPIDRLPEPLRTNARGGRRDFIRISAEPARQ